MVDLALKVRENRARRAAIRQGLMLKKNPVRDQRASGFATYMLVDVATRHIQSSGPCGNYGLNLDEIEQVLNGDMPRNPAPKPARSVTRWN